jgi:DNA modification methylase
MTKKVNSSKPNQDSPVEIQGSNDNSKLGTVLGKNVFRVDINLVEPHPSVMEVYEKKDLKGLKLTMNLVGQLETMKAVHTGDLYRIFDGISRLLVAKELGWKTIYVEVFEYSDDEIQDRFVLHNFRTKRSIKELCRQAEVVLGILGLSQGKKRERIGGLSMGDDDFSLVGRDRFEIACEVIGADISVSTLRRLLEVKDFEENGNDEIKGFDLMGKIESKEMKVHQAYNVMTTYKNSKKEEGSNALTEAMKVVKGRNFTLFNQSCEDLHDISDQSIDSTVISGPYFQQRDYPDGVRDMEQSQHGMESTVDEYVQKEVEIYSGLYRKLKKTGSLFVVITDSYDKLVNCLVVEKLILGMVKSGWFLNQKIYWLKDNQKPQNDQSKRLLPTYEYILHFVKDPQLFYYREFKIWKEDGTYRVDRGSKDSGFGHKMNTHTWTLKKPLVRFRNFLSEQSVRQLLHTNGFNWTELKDIDPAFRHLAPYPSVIPLLPILLTTKIGDTVLDIFNGTGTTTAVALQLGRKVIGYDTDTKSHLFAAKRLQMVEENLPTNNEVNELEKEFMEDSNLTKESDNTRDQEMAV